MTIHETSQHWSAVGWLIGALEHDHPGYLQQQINRATDSGFLDTAAGLRQMLAITQSSDREPRERAVPCRIVGCTAMTWNWQALCGRHLEQSDESAAPRRLTAVDPPSLGDVDDAPVGGRAFADRGHTRTA